MLKHADIWAAIDGVARDHGLTASALARKAGLDPTTFNKSKRITRDGKPRWPSTESVAKVLEATGLSLAGFVVYVDGHSGGGTRRLPLAATAQAAPLFDESGHPTGDGWDAIAFPTIDDPHAYALEISGDSLRPLYRDGDVVVVSPAASIRRGDRLVLGLRAGGLLIRPLLRQSAARVELAAPDGISAGDSLDLGDIAWMARILWASQ